jgi:hypothetical protein
LPRRIALIILSNFHYRLHHEIRLPSWRNRRLTKTESYSSLQAGIHNSQSSSHYVSWIHSYKKQPDSCTWTHEILDWRKEYGSAITEKNVLFRPSLKYVSRYADHFYICKNEHLEKNLYTKASASAKFIRKKYFFIAF